MAQKKKVEAKAKATKPVASAVKKASPKVPSAKVAKPVRKPESSAARVAQVAQVAQVAKSQKPSVAAKAAGHASSRAAVAAKITKPVVAPVVAKTVAAKPAAAKAASKPFAKQPAAAAAATKPAAIAPRPAAASPSKSTPLPQASLAMRAAATGIASPVRTVPANVAKPGGQKLTALVPPAGVPTPKALAEKAAQQRQMINAQKKPVSQRHGFKTNEFVVYPAHGVGRIVGIEEQEIAGMSLELFVITFDKEKLTLRVPTGKLATVGMRKLADEALVKKAMEILKGRARVKRTMWSRRAQEYVAKINSGDLISIAEVVRDLFRSEAQPEQSYSERQLYEDALDRMAREIAAVDKLDERGAVQRITDVLSKSAKGRRMAEGGSDEAEFKAA